MHNKWACRTAVAAVVLVGVAFSARGAAQESGSMPAAQHYSGSSLFTTYCVSCHGDSGKGDGPFAGALRAAPADLTIIAKNSGGVFSRDDVGRIIDGRNPIKGHGGKDMPVWGDAFAHSADGPDAVAEKIQSLVAYIESIQQKP